MSAAAVTVTPNPWVGGPISISVTPSTTSQSVEVQVSLSGNIAGSGLLTPNNPSLPINYKSGDDSASGTVSVQFATGEQLNLLMAENLTGKSLTQEFPAFSGQLATWGAPSLVDSSY
jgi:hypothetical protein